MYRYIYVDRHACTGPAVNYLELQRIHESLGPLKMGPRLLRPVRDDSQILALILI